MYKKLNIKEQVKEGKQAYFQFFADNELWYITEDGYLFPVPIDDASSGCFKRDEKAIHLMRGMRKWNEKLDELGIDRKGGRG